MDRNKLAKRNLKDSVFSILFSKPEYVKELLYSITGERTDEKIEIVTTKNVLCNGIYNDLGFLVGERKLYLVEAQSTVSPNIIYRINEYYIRTLRERIGDYPKLFGRTPIMEMDRPVFTVVYTGNEDVLDAYETEIYDISGQSYIIRVKILTKHNTTGILKAYCIFCEKYDEYRSLYGRTAEAVSATIKYCLLCEDTAEIRKFLLEYRVEVEMIMEEYNEQELIFDSLLAEGARKAKAEERDMILRQMRKYFSNSGFSEDFQREMYNGILATEC